MNVFRLVKDVVIGRARNFSDKKIFHSMSLIALLAWVGLGADGLSSSCYGPEAAFLALKSHTHLSLFVALASVLTIVVICASYSQIIELFPTGGGGYLVASKLLSPTAGVVAGSALIGDYILTIAISVASGADAVFSMLPLEWQVWKLKFSLGIIVFLTLLNLRGAKESVMLWVPIFFVFVFTYVFAIVWAVAAHFGDLPGIAHGVVTDVRTDSSEVGWFGLIVVLLRAYSLGAGTYTGIEAVSNGLNTLREPRVQTGKRTMIYMGASLSFVVGGLLLAYLLYQVTPVDGKTLNAVLFEKITATWPASLSHGFVIADERRFQFQSGGGSRGGRVSLVQPGDEREPGIEHRIHAHRERPGILLFRIPRLTLKEYVSLGETAAGFRGLAGHLEQLGFRNELVSLCLRIVTCGGTAAKASNRRGERLRSRLAGRREIRWRRRLRGPGPRNECRADR